MSHPALKAVLVTADVGTEDVLAATYHTLSVWFGQTYFQIVIGGESYVFEYDLIVVEVIFPQVIFVPFEVPKQQQTPTQVQTY